MTELRAAERDLIHCASKGLECDLSGHDAAARRVRAATVARVCRGQVGELHAKGLRLRGARIEGDLDLENAVLEVSLQLHDCEITGGVDLTDATIPLVMLRSCGVGGPVRAGGLRSRSVSLRDSTVAGPVDLRGAVVSGRLSLEGVVLQGADEAGIALDARGTRIDGTLRFGGARSGPVRLTRASIGINLEMDGTELTGRDRSGYSLDIRGLHVVGATFLREGFVTEGAIRAVGAAVDGGLYLTEAVVGGTNPEGIAVQARGLRSNGSITAEHRVEVAGGVWLEGAAVLGDVQLDGLSITGSDTDGTALNATGLQVGGAFRLPDLRARGAVRLSDAVIGGSLSLRGARLERPFDRYGNSLAADGVRVGRSLHLSGGFSAQGEVRLVGAAVDGQLSFAQAERFPMLSLRGAHCAELEDTRASWPAVGKLELRGFRFGGLKVQSGWEERLDWVRRQGEENWSPEPYEQLAAYYRVTGDEGAARRILVEKNDDEIRHLRVTRGWRSLGYRLWRRPLGWLVGYGYRRHRAAWLLVGLILAAGLLFHRAEGDGAMVPHEPPAAATGSATGAGADVEGCGVDHPCFNSWVYGADVVLPIIDFGQDTAWRPVESDEVGPTWIWARWAFIALGWVLASVFVAAFTGVVQKP